MPASVTYSSLSLTRPSQFSACSTWWMLVLPLISQCSPSMTTSGASSSSGSSPTMASSRSWVVTSPWMTPNSSATRMRLPRAWRSSAKSRITLMVCGTMMGSFCLASCASGWPSFRANSRSRAFTTPMISSSSPSQTGNRLWGARCSRVRISSALSFTSIHSISALGVMMVRMERSARESTPLTM